MALVSRSTLVYFHFTTFGTINSGACNVNSRYATFSASHSTCHCGIAVHFYRLSNFAMHPGIFFLVVLTHSWGSYLEQNCFFLWCFRHLTPLMKRFTHLSWSEKKVAVSDGLESKGACVVQIKQKLSHFVVTSIGIVTSKPIFMAG